MEEVREVQQEEADVQIIENDEVDENEAAGGETTHEDRRRRKIDRREQIWEKIRKTEEANKRATAIMAVQIEADLLEYKKKIAEAKANDSKAQEEKRGIKYSSKNVSKIQNGRNKTLPPKSRDDSIKTLSANHLNGPRQLERILVSLKLENRMLHPYEVTADNNSLYTAICNQLEMMNNQVMTVEELRKNTSEYIKKNKNAFVSSMINNDSSVILSERDLDNFCDQIRWGQESGSRLELKAIMHVISNPICVIQAIGPDEIYETPESNGPPLVITRYEHLYKNNCDDHYDSTLLIEYRLPYEMDNVTFDTETH